MSVQNRIVNANTYVVLIVLTQGLSINSFNSHNSPVGNNYNHIHFMDEFK